MVFLFFIPRENKTREKSTRGDSLESPPFRLWLALWFPKRKNYVQTDRIFSFGGRWRQGTFLPSNSTNIINICLIKITMTTVKAIWNEITFQRIRPAGGVCAYTTSTISRWWRFYYFPFICTIRSCPLFFFVFFFSCSLPAVLAQLDARSLSSLRMYIL